jgi:hypothetical protein
MRKRKLLRKEKKQKEKQKSMKDRYLASGHIKTIGNEST